MKRTLPLLRRLELELNTTSSETEKDLTLGKLYLIGSQINKFSNQDLYYNRLANHTCFINMEEEPSKEDIKLGKELYNSIKNSISLPAPLENKYNKKMINATNIEYQILLKFFNQK